MLLDLSFGVGVGVTTELVTTIITIAEFTMAVLTMVTLTMELTVTLPDFIKHQDYLLEYCPFLMLFFFVVPLFLRIFFYFSFQHQSP